jgi:enediyne biosynthesis protein E4
VRASWDERVTPKCDDSDPNYLYLNRGDGTFEESALTYSGDGRTQANMGVAIGDYDNDGLIDVLTTTFSEDYFPLFRQIRPGFYEDVSSRVGLTTVTPPWVGKLLTTTYRQPFVVMRNTGGRFLLESETLDNANKDSYRGGAACDFNNDGKLDLVILPIDGPALLLENNTQTSNNWIGLHLRGFKKNRDAIGAFVRAEACGKFQVDSVRAGSSYLSRDDPRLHFGIGSCVTLDRVIVTWPGGREQVISQPPVNRYSTIREPS